MPTMQVACRYDCTCLRAHKFTGKERDAESGWDNFGKRYYSSGMGIFISPDPCGLNIKHLLNPQKWNMYCTC